MGCSTRVARTSEGSGELCVFIKKNRESLSTSMAVMYAPPPLRTRLTHLPGQWLQCQANGSNLWGKYVFSKGSNSFHRVCDL